MTLGQLSPRLLTFLQLHFPLIPDLAGVSLTFRNPWTGSDGLTLGRSITLRPTYDGQLATLQPNAVQLLCHELTHVEQFGAWGSWWWVGYLLRHSAWEAQAYQRAAELRQMWEEAT